MKRIVIFVFVFLCLSDCTYAQEAAKPQAPTTPPAAEQVKPKVVTLTEEQQTVLIQLLEQQKNIELKIQGAVDMLKAILKLPDACQPSLNTNGKPQFLCPPEPVVPKP